MSAGRRVAGVGLATASGVMVAVQSRINGELGVRLADGIAAAVVSFGVGLLILLVLVPATPGGRRGLGALRGALRTGTLRPWQCLGGVCGAFLVATQGLTIGALGVAVFTVAVVAGQSGSSLLVDRAGIGPTGRQPVTPNRLIGAVLTVLAVLLAVGDRLGDPDALALALLPLAAGVGIAWQQAVNGRVRAASGSAMTATLVNFTVGTAALLVTFAVDLVVRGRPAGAFPDEPWLYLGGPLGIVFIALAAALVRFTGVLLLGLATIAGQIVGAVLLDLVLPTAASHPGLDTLLGAALTMVAVLVAAFGPARRP
ncbi:MULTISPECIES: DMT family transporter [unclassified Micromonospora]|uniref:DMT family transporter n=2 Tax=unclassified Micromonospora TaxID=2617518 RepID=UPI001C2240AC|nr:MULTISPECIES: DMT family transporter [unclassified Micromonospora]MBU8858893.1 DMT family transporter [Micromonospora sp. WMMB482]MDM4778393.1 DMT family transporter [Micromonospora sp. b486]